MASRIVTISFTGLNAGGGVPKVNRDIRDAFHDRERQHFCWDDCARSLTIHEANLQEWQKARLLNDWLVRNRYVTADDVIIADGFWADGLEHLPKVISHSHGIWSHLTKEDVEAGKSPDMPLHHAAQVAFRKKWTRLGKPLTAVSDFIADQMKLQWGFESTVINNGVDTEEQYDRFIANRTSFAPLREQEKLPEEMRVRVILHGVNDKTNLNKGWDHIKAITAALTDYEVLSLDNFAERLVSECGFPTLQSAKLCALGNASLVVHPSGYEGNSMFVAEALACGVPIVGYDVGAMADQDAWACGMIFRRNIRSPEQTLHGVKHLLSHDMMRDHCGARARSYAVEKLSIIKFRENWRSYVQQLEEKHV